MDFLAPQHPFAIFLPESNDIFAIYTEPTKLSLENNSSFIFVIYSVFSRPKNILFYIYSIA